MTWRHILPMSFTIAAMVAGFLSILKAASGEFMLSSQLIMLSMILDGIDGNLARWIKGTSKFGAEVDTYVDIMSFGIAPAVLSYHAVLHGFGISGLVLSTAMVFFGIMRLSRFRITDKYRGQRGYTGLPITVNAGIIVLSVFIVESGVFSEEVISLSHGPFAAMVWTCSVVFLVLQVSNLQYTKPTKEIIFFLPCVFLVLLMFLKDEIAVSACIAMCIGGLFYAFVTPFLPKHDILVDADDEDEPVSVQGR